jgi:hypothetical protein
LNLHSRVSSLLQVCPSLAFNGGIRIKPPSALSRGIFEDVDLKSTFSWWSFPRKRNPGLFPFHPAWMPAAAGMTELHFA